MNLKKMKNPMITLSILVIALLIGVGAYATYGSESKVFGSVFYAIESEKSPVEDKVTVVHEDTTSLLVIKTHFYKYSTVKYL